MIIIWSNWDTQTLGMQKLSQRQNTRATEALKIRELRQHEPAVYCMQPHAKLWDMATTDVTILGTYIPQSGIAETQQIEFWVGFETNDSVGPLWLILNDVVELLNVKIRLTQHF